MDLLKKSITLTTGVKAVVTELVGKHQKYITRNPNDINEGLEEVLLDVLVELGSKKTITQDDIENLLSSDKQLILVVARELATDNEPFKFKYDYKHNGKKKSVEMVYDFHKDGEFPVTPFKKFDESTGKYIDADFKEYKHVVKDFFITLPRTKKKVRFTALDGKGEKVGSATSKSERSSHTVLMMRRPVEFIKTEKSEVPVVLNLDTLPLKDIEYLRKSIKEVEGNVGTEIAFDHPETGEPVYIDALGTVAFFFPSEAI